MKVSEKGNLLLDWVGNLVERGPKQYNSLKMKDADIAINRAKKKMKGKEERKRSDRVGAVSGLTF